MDKIDQKILAALDRDPRITTTKLAREARVSQQVADYRMERLNIAKFGTIINLKALGLEQYRIFFTFNANFSAEKIFAYLRSRKGVYWAARIGGRYDLLVVLFVKDFAVYDHFLDEFNKTFPGLVKDYRSTYAIEHSLYRHKYLSKGLAISYGYDDEAVEIDDLDRHILHKMKDNCRISSLEMAKNVSYKTVINRIRALEHAKVILGYRLFLKTDKRPFIVLLSYKNYDKAEEKKFLAHLAAEEAATQTVRLFGIWNLCVHLRLDSNEDLQNLIIKWRDAYEIIDDFEIIPVFEDIAINLMP